MYVCIYQVRTAVVCSFQPPICAMQLFCFFRCPSIPYLPLFSVPHEHTTYTQLPISIIFIVWQLRQFRRGDMPHIIWIGGFLSFSLPTITINRVLDLHCFLYSRGYFSPFFPRRFAPTVISPATASLPRIYIPNTCHNFRKSLLNRLTLLTILLIRPQSRFGDTAFILQLFGPQNGTGYYSDGLTHHNLSTWFSLVQGSQNKKAHTHKRTQPMK